MGIFIYLDITPYKIKPDKWAEVYEESLMLLKSYPEELMSLQEEELGFTNRIVFSRELESHCDNPEKRYWHVVGDLKTQKNAESFILHYDLNYYRRRPCDFEDSDDILIDMVKGEGYNPNIFDNKTQGYFYHYPILAVTSLIESRFPGYALTRGNIDVRQAKEVVERANKILNKNITIPVCTDGERLCRRLKKHFKGTKLIDTFQEFFCGSEKTFYKVIFELIDREEVLQWFRDTLKDCDCPSIIIARNLLIEWLKQTRDIESLCKIACLDENGPQFEPVEFVSSIASAMTFIEDKEYKIFKNVFDKSNGNTSFENLFLDVYLQGKRKGRYTNKEEFSKILSKYFPKNIEKINSIIASRTKEFKEILNEKEESLSDVFGSLLELWDDDYVDFDEGNIFLKFQSYENLSKDLQKSLEIFVYQIREVQRKSSKLFLEKFERFEAREIWEKIVIMMGKRRVALTEDAWKWIDNEKDKELLWVLLSLSMINEWEVTFWNMRRAVFENRGLCQEVKKLINNNKKMLEIENLAKKEGQIKKLTFKE